MRELKVKRLDPRAELPVRAHSNDAGLDLKCLDNFILPPRTPIKISTGLSFEIEPGFSGIIFDRSSMGFKGVSVLGGVVDSGYTGEVSVILLNSTDFFIKIESGSKIAQMVVLPITTPTVVEIDSIAESSRGSGGFGSTGV